MTYNTNIHSQQVASVNYVPYGQTSVVDNAPLLPSYYQEVAPPKKSCCCCRCSLLTICVTLFIIALILGGLATLVAFLVRDPSFTLTNFAVQPPQDNNTLIPVLLYVNCSNPNIISADVSAELSLYLSDGTSYLGDGTLNKTHIAANGVTPLVFQLWIEDTGPSFQEAFETLIVLQEPLGVVVDYEVTGYLGALHLTLNFHESTTIQPPSTPSSTGVNDYQSL